VSTPHKAHFATFPALKKCFLTAAMSTTLHELSLFHVAGWQQLFFSPPIQLLLLPSHHAFDIGPGPSPPTASQDNHQEPHRFEQKQRQRQKFKATALADVTSFKVPTKD